MAASMARYFPKVFSSPKCKWLQNCRHLIYQSQSQRLSVIHPEVFSKISLDESRATKYFISRRFANLHKDRKCWKCDSPTDDKKELFFCNCGVVQKVPSDLNYFQAMNCDKTFDIDSKSLSQFYKELQWKLHPDKYSKESKEEQKLAEEQSSFINKAYNTLLKPLSRGEYLLELHGDPIEEANTAVDPEFLMEIMEFNEDIVEVTDNSQALQQLNDINNVRMEVCVKEISAAFSENNVPKAKQLLVKLKYFSNIDDKIKLIRRNKMGH